MIATVTAEQGGTQGEPYGSDPKGILMFDENGRYTLVLLRPDLPTFGSSNRTTGTPEENRAVVQGSIAHLVPTRSRVAPPSSCASRPLRFQTGTEPSRNGRSRSQGANSSTRSQRRRVGAPPNWSGPGSSRGQHPAKTTVVGEQRGGFDAKHTVSPRFSGKHVLGRPRLCPKSLRNRRGWRPCRPISKGGW